MLAPGCDPLQIARACVEERRFAELYLADLDAIQEGRPQFDLIRRLTDLPVDFLLDLGIRSAHDLDQARRRLGSERIRYVLATETLSNVDELRRSIAESDAIDRIAIGLDFVRGSFRTGAGDGRESVEVWIGAAQSAGIADVVALDLDRVGSDLGFAWPAALGASSAFRSFSRKISGGGIRSLDDLRCAGKAGCDGVLVGSALHDGRISPADLTPAALSKRPS